MFDDPEAPQPKKRKPKKRNTLFRNRSKVPVDPQRQPLDFTPDTPAMRQRKAAELRRKLIRIGIGALAAVALVALGNAAINETVLLNPSFSLKRVNVESAGMLTPQQLRRATELPDGVNLVTVDLANVRTRLLALPAVEAAEVERDFDGTLTLKVRQRKPVAWVHCEHMRYLPKTSGRGLLVDAFGYAIPAEVVLNEYASLPIISDEAIDQAPPGAVIKEPNFKSALQLLNLLKESEAETGVALQSIAMPNSFALEAHFADGATVTFGYNEMEEQVTRYCHVLANAKSRQWSIDKLTVIAKFNLPASFKDINGEPVGGATESTSTSQAPASSSPSAPKAQPVSTKKSTSKSSTNRKTSH